MEISETAQDSETLLFIDVVWLEDKPEGPCQRIVRSGKVIYGRRKD